ncbi:MULTISPECIES: acylphosphatase [Pseudomonas]|uniref:acylphosphatase n=1 Tax=Pseudomonas TaxID=286 RepID=UPI00085502EA|nr:MULTISPECIES: acylphosphatase [Pseudomonas]OEO23993.1 acylphosphatase [Pseudomonas sp. J237]SFU03413.1 acylphosphatase [Pseudomonas marincola]
MTQICMHGFVSGLVQGVGYRQATAEKAEELELNGWTRNLADSRVEVLCEGEQDAVEAFVEWLKQGPQAADVSEVSLTEQPLQGIAGFIVRR